MKNNPKNNITKKIKQTISIIAIYIFAGLTLGIGSAHASGPASTRYPIVLVHGLYGFDKLFGGLVEYWNGIPEALARDGAQVYVLQISPVDTYEVRGEQALQQIENILALTGAEKVNLIGHSMGSPTIRYVAAVRPDIVASLTSVDGVVQGSAVADSVVAGDSAITYGVLNLLAELIRVGAGDPSYHADVKAGMRVLTSDYMQNTFNPRYPRGLPSTPCASGPEQVDGIYYYSWRGDRVSTNFADLTDYAFGITALAFNGAANDGLVSTCAQSFGKVVATYHQNHIDQVNLLWGLVNVFEVNPITVYRIHANRLKNAGL